MCTNKTTLLQYFKNIKPGGCFGPPPLMSLGKGKQPPCVRFLKYCKSLISALNMLIYFRLHCLLYIFNRQVDASQANLLKKALGILDCFCKATHIFIAFTQFYRTQEAIPNSYDKYEPGLRKSANMTSHWDHIDSSIQKTFP